MVMNTNIFDINLHMINHYRRLNSAKSVVNTSRPNSYKYQRKCNTFRKRYSTPSSLCNEGIPSRTNSTTEIRRYPKRNGIEPAGRSLSVPPVPKNPPTTTTLVRKMNNVRPKLKPKPPPPPKLTKTKTLSSQPDYSAGPSTKRDLSPPSVNEYKTFEQSNRKLRKPIPMPRRSLTTSKKPVVPEYEYLQFSLRITEDIIRNDLYSPSEMRRVFNSHVEANRGRLNTMKMLHQIDHLCKELNISKKISRQFADVEQITSSCYTCKLKEPKCQGTDTKEPILQKVVNDGYALSDEDVRQLSDEDLENVFTGIINDEVVEPVPEQDEIFPEEVDAYILELNGGDERLSAKESLSNGVKEEEEFHPVLELIEPLAVGVEGLKSKSSISGSHTSTERTEKSSSSTLKALDEQSNGSVDAQSLSNKSANSKEEDKSLSKKSSGLIIEELLAVNGSKKSLRLEGQGSSQKSVESPKKSETSISSQVECRSVCRKSNGTIQKSTPLVTEEGNGIIKKPSSLIEKNGKIPAENCDCKIGINESELLLRAEEILKSIVSNVSLKNNEKLKHDILNIVHCKPNVIYKQAEANRSTQTSVIQSEEPKITEDNLNIIEPVVTATPPPSPESEKKSKEDIGSEKELTEENLNILPVIIATPPPSPESEKKSKEDIDSEKEITEENLNVKPVITAISPPSPESEKKSKEDIGSEKEIIDIVALVKKISKETESNDFISTIKKLSGENANILNKIVEIEKYSIKSPENEGIANALFIQPSPVVQDFSFTSEPLSEGEIPLNGKTLKNNRNNLIEHLNRYEQMSPGTNRLEQKNVTHITINNYEIKNGNDRTLGQIAQTQTSRHADISEGEVMSSVASNYGRGSDVGTKTDSSTTT